MKLAIVYATGTPAVGANVLVIARTKEELDQVKLWILTGSQPHLDFKMVDAAVQKWIREHPSGGPA